MALVSPQGAWLRVNRSLCNLLGYTEREMLDSNFQEVTHPEDIGFVTANGWDAAGAGAFGFRVAWLRTNPSAILPAVGAPEPVIATWSTMSLVFTR